MLVLFYTHELVLFIYAMGQRKALAFICIELVGEVLCMLPSQNNYALSLAGEPLDLKTKRPKTVAKRETSVRASAE